MTKDDEAFLKRLRATFRVEAEEHIQAMSSALLEFEKTPTDENKEERVERIFRHAHSLKGGARVTNFGTIERICQSLEDVFSAWKRGKIDLAPADFDVLHAAIGLIGQLLLAAQDSSSESDEQQISAIVRQIGRLIAPDPARVLRDEPRPPTSTPTNVAPESAATPAAAAPAAAVSVAEVAPVRTVLAETIRVSTAKLDRLLLEAEEMLTVKQATAQHATDLRALEPGFAEWTKQWTRVQPVLRRLRREPASELMTFLEWNFGYLKALEGKVRALSRSATQDSHDVGRRVDDLLVESKSLVMLPLATLLDLFPRLVRELSREQGKDVDLVVRGGEVEMDKRILEAMKDPLIHLVRNCIDHGIEKPDARIERKKPARATIAISVAPVNGRKVEIVIADDGSGIDLGRVKESAVKRGVILPEEAQALDEQKCLELIFRSEVSTSPIITEISGRGLGLAIVREKTEKLGGHVFVESKPGAGTTFRIALPLTLATFRGILVQVAGQGFVIPTAHVERVARVKSSEIKTVENRETISLEDRAVSLARLERILELNGSDVAAGDYVSVVVLGTGDEQIAFAVEAVLHDEEVLVKSLPRPLSRVRNIAGATVLASGKVVPILNVADLMKSARKAVVGTATPSAARASDQARAKTILLAEDSITSRMLLKGILEAAGYRVKTAVDGVEALTLLRTESFDLVVSDVEMPRMNGFDLTAHIRAEKKLADLPVVLVTALSSEADRERGIDVGADAYIVKSDFDQNNLLDVLRRLA